jgi:hypothetical protein
MPALAPELRPPDDAFPVGVEPEVFEAFEVLVDVGAEAVAEADDVELCVEVAGNYAKISIAITSSGLG